VGKTLASDFVPQSLRASSIGWYSTIVGITGLIASIIAGKIWDNLGHQAVFIYGTVFAILGTIGLVIFIPNKRVLES
jgi:MFS family permease